MNTRTVITFGTRRSALLSLGTALAFMLSGVAQAGSSSCSISCPRGSCTIKIVEAGPLGAGTGKGVSSREVIVRYAYSDPLALQRFTFGQQEQASIDMLAARAGIEKDLPGSSAVLDALATAIEASDRDGVHKARQAIRRAYRDAGLSVPAFASGADEEVTSLAPAKAGVDCYCDSAGDPACEQA